VLDQAWQDLPAGAYIAVVDFHCSPLRWFRQWMQFNHVRMEKHLLPELEQRFTTNFKTVKSAYGGLWQYFIFVGQKR
jgi:S-adenosylmethionine-diacylgycerolhomoserine-N-methlytransferase